MPDLCLTLAETSLAQLQEKIAHYAGRVPFVEVRLDYLDPPVLPQLPTASGTEFLATLRPSREGGRYGGSERERLQLLRQAAPAGFGWIDLEHDVEETDWPPPLRIVRSIHCLDAFPDSLDALLARLQERGEVSKIAVQVSSTRQLVRLLDWMEALPHNRKRVVLGMGELGQPSRFLGALLGNRWTYVSESTHKAAAAGQFSLQEAQQAYALPERSRPRLFGVLGNPIAHSLSPLLHNALFRHYGIEALYLPLPLDELEPWFAYLRRSGMDFRGFSVTLPFKTGIVRFLARNHAPFESVNTLALQNGWQGFNTDYQGFLNPLERRLSLAGMHALVLGNGGMALTAVEALQDRGCRVTAVGRNPEKMAAFADRTGCCGLLFEDLPLRAGLCVNTTPLGQHPQLEASPLQPSQLDSEWVYDLVYRPRRTRLLQIAEAKGAKTISGLEMFVEQAALQFKLWTQIDPERQLMEEIVAES